MSTSSSSDSPGSGSVTVREALPTHHRVELGARRRRRLVRCQFPPLRASDRLWPAPLTWASRSKINSARAVEVKRDGRCRRWRRAEQLSEPQRPHRVVELAGNDAVAVGVPRDEEPLNCRDSWRRTPAACAAPCPRCVVQIDLDVELPPPRERISKFGSAPRMSSDGDRPLPGAKIRRAQLLRKDWHRHRPRDHPRRTREQLQQFLPHRFHTVQPASMRSGLSHWYLCQLLL